MNTTITLLLFLLAGAALISRRVRKIAFLTILAVLIVAGLANVGRHLSDGRQVAAMPTSK